jgi:hypothetical protein
LVVDLAVGILNLVALVVQVEAEVPTTLAEVEVPALLDKTLQMGQTHHLLAEAILQVKDSLVGMALKVDTPAAVVVVQNLAEMEVQA